MPERNPMNQWTKLTRAANLIIGLVLVAAAAAAGLVLWVAGGSAVLNNPVRTFQFFTPIGFCLFLGLLFRASFKLRIGIAITIVLALPVVLGINWYYGQPEVINPHFKIAKKLGLKVDERTYLDVMRDERAAGREAWLNFIPQTFLGNPLLVRGNPVQPLANIRNARVVLCNESGMFVWAETDEVGFHNPRRIWTANDRIDIMMIGDSFVSGYCVPRKDSLAGLLRTRYPKLVALGRGGLGPLSEFAILREYLAAARPKLVLWEIYKDDFNNLRHELASPILRRYLDDPGFSQSLFDRGSDIDHALRVFHAEKVRRLVRNQELPFLGLRHLSNLFLPRLISKMWSVVRQPDDDIEPVPIFSTILDRARRLAEDAGAQFVVVYFSGYRRYDLPRARSKNKETHDLVLGITRSLKIDTIDTTTAILSRLKDPRSMHFFGTMNVIGRSEHYTPEGYRIVAEPILDYLKVHFGPGPGLR